MSNLKYAFLSNLKYEHFIYKHSNLICYVLHMHDFKTSLSASVTSVLCLFHVPHIFSFSMKTIKHVVKLWNFYLHIQVCIVYDFLLKNSNIRLKNIVALLRYIHIWHILVNCYVLHFLVSLLSFCLLLQFCLKLCW